MRQPLLTQMKERLRRSRNWFNAIEELEKEAEAVEDHQQRFEVLYELAQVSEEIVPERDRALGLYQRAWKVDKANPKALRRARELYQELGRREMVAKVGQLELKLFGEDEDLVWLVAEALLDCGQREKALPLLVQAAQAKPDLVRIKDAIAAAQYDPEFWADNVERLTSEADNADSPTAARMLLRAARIMHNETPENEGLEELLLRVLEADANDASANFLYEMLLSTAERWDDLFKHHLRRGLMAEEADKADLYRRLALEWVQRFNDRGRGAELFAKAVMAAASTGQSKLRSLVAAFVLIREVFGGEGRWEDLLELSDAVLPHLENEQKLFVTQQAGIVAWKELGDAERAKPYFRSVRDMEAESPDLADFVSEVGELTEAAEAAEAEPAEAAEPEAAEAAEAEPVEAAESEAAEPVEAAESEAAEAAEAAEAEPVETAEPEAAEAEPVEAAEPEADEPEAAEPAEPEVAAAPAAPEEIAGDLQSLLDAAEAAEEGGPDQAIDAWKKAVAAAPDMRTPRRGLARVLRGAERWPQLVDALKDEEAKAAHSGPDKVEVFGELAAVYEQLKRWPDMVASLDKQAPHIEDDAERAAVYLRVATLYIERFSNQASAIKAFEKVLEIDRDNDTAIEHLRAVYEKRRDWAKLINLRESEIDRTEDADERASMTIEVAELAAQRVRKPDVCMHWWAKVLDVDPGHDQALAELEKLYERAKKWDELTAVLEKKVLIASDDKTQTDALQKLGLIYTDKAENKEKAVESWRRLLNLDPKHRRAQDALKKLYIAEGDWDALEGFYRDQDKLAEFIRVLERQVDSEESEEAQLAVALKIAVMYRDEIKKADRAARAFERVLTIDENSLTAAEALIPLYEGGRDPRKLARVLQIQLESTEDPDVRQERIKRLAEFSEEKMRDKAAAFGWWTKAHEEDHEAEWIRTEIERLAKETGSFAELVATYRTSAEKFTDPVDALALLAVVASLEEAELGDVDAALETNRRILAADEQNEDALNALERLYLGRERYDELLQIYQAKFDLSNDPDERVAIQVKIGQLYEEEVKDDGKAIETYQSILEQHGEDLAALGALVRIFDRTEKWHDLADVVSRQLLLVEPEGASLASHVDLKNRLGQLRERYLEDVPGAIEAYREVLELDAANESARLRLESRLMDEDHKLAAAEILEPVYEAGEQWSELVDVHEIQADSSDDQFRRVGLFTKIGDLQAKKLGDAAAAFDAYARAFGEDSSTEEAKKQLEELCNLLDDGWQKLVELYEKAVENPDLAPSLSHELSIKIAKAYTERLGDTEKAVTNFRRALEVEPDDLDAINALEGIFATSERYEDLLKVYRRKVDITSDGDERMAILFHIAAIYEENLENPEDSIATYSEVLANDGENLRALRALDRLYTQVENWQELADNLGRQLILTDIDGERVELLVRLGALRENKLSEVGSAIETYRQVLDIDTQNEPSVTALEQLISNEEHELAIAQVLEPIYQAAGEWKKQISVFEIMAKHAYDPGDKIELLQRIAELYELGGEDGDASFGIYARALKEDPRNHTTVAQLERLARHQDKWRDLVILFNEIAADLSDEDLKVQLLTRKGQIQELELSEDAEAVKTYEQILDGMPSHIDAASSIQAIHERNADYKSLVGILRRKSELILDLPERKELLHKAAKVLEEILEDAESAVATYQQILDLDDVDKVALDALDRLYVRMARWEPLRDIYAKKADLAETPEEKIRLLHVLGSVYETELDDPEKAIEAHQTILDIDADERDAIGALDRLYEKSERWYDLLSTRERMIELAETNGEAVALKYRIGQLWENQLQDVARAVESYREALDLDAQHVETLAALDALVKRDGGEPVMAARVLEPVYEATFEFEKLIEVLEVIATHAEDSDDKVGLLHRIAEIHEARLEQLPQAFGAFGRALVEDNANDLSLGHLERLADATSAWVQLAELYKTEGDKTLDVPRQVDLLMRLARVYEEELTATEDAVATYKKIAEVEYDNRDAVLALDRLYTATEMWPELTEILKREVQLADSDDEIIGLQFRVGQVFEQCLKDIGGALEAYREILVTDPTHSSTLAALEMLFLDGQKQAEIGELLEPLYQSAGEFEKLHKIYEVQLGGLTDPTERQSMLQRLAELAEQQLYDGARAASWWGAAYIEDPRSETAFDELERLSEEQSSWHELVSVYVRALEKAEEADARRQTLLRLARVHQNRLGDHASAVETYLRVLEVDARDAEALEALDGLYDAAGMFDELVDVLRRRIEIVLDGDEIIALHLRRGRVFADALADPDQALACYEAVLDQESRNRDALEALEALFFQRRDWSRLLATYEKLIDVTDGDEELADVYARMARIASDALDDAEQATDLWNRVLDIRGEESQALAAVAELLGRREAWEDLVEVIERQVGAAEEPADQVALYKRLGRVWAERLGRERNALDAWLCAFEIDPNDLHTLEMLAYLYRSTESWEELAQTLSSWIEVGQLTGGVSEADLVELYAQWGELEGNVLGRIDAAVDAWQRVLSLSGSADFRALDALEQLFTREARWEECIGVLEKRATAISDSEPDKQIETLLQAGAIWEEKVYDNDRAALVYERVRLADVTNARAPARLEEIYTNDGKWAELVEVLLAWADSAPTTPQKIHAFRTMAHIYEDHFQNLENAFFCLQAAFNEDFTDEDTGADLERLATSAGKWSELLAQYTENVQTLEQTDPENAANLWVKIGRWYCDQVQNVDYGIHSVQQALRLNADHLGALAALADFQRQRGSWHELVETLTHHAKVEVDVDRKVDVYLSLADLFESQLGDDDQAIAAYRAGLEADESGMDALISLERLYRKGMMWEPLVDALGRMATLESDDERVIARKLEIGRIWDEALQDSGQSIESYSEVLESDSQNLPALQALESLYERTNQSEKYLDVLESQLDATQEEQSHVALYQRMAAAWEERFSKLDRAAECHEKIVAIDDANHQSYGELARLYREESKWESLVDCYRRHIMATSEPADQVELYVAMGSVYESELRDYDRAIESYSDVLANAPDESRALDALGRLYEQIEEWERSIDVMVQLAGTTTEPKKQVDLYYRIGRIMFARLDQADEAENQLLQGLALEATHVPTMEQLVELYSKQGDWLKAAQMMVRAEAATENTLEKIRLLFDAAEVYRDKLGQREDAKELYAAVLSIDPEHVEAGEPLSEIYFESGEWQSLSPVLDMLCRKLAQENRGQDELNVLYFRTARCADELGDFDKSAQFYKSAYEIDSTYLPTLLGRADLLYKVQDWNGAGKIYQTILVQHRDSQDEADVVRTYYRLGMVRHQLGERKKALNMFEKALEIDPNHPDTLISVIDIQGGQGDWDAVIHAKRGLMASAETELQIELLSEIGEVYDGKLSNPQKAVGAFQEALEIKPGDHQLLQRVLDLYTATEQWKRAVETIERFIEVETNPVIVGSYFQAAGTICRDKLKAADEAIEYYNKSLDAFFADPAKIPDRHLPRALKAFADIDKILTTKRDWQNQQRAYRKMIKRLQPKPGSDATSNPNHDKLQNVLINLMHALGEIYRSRLKSYDEAIAAFELAQQLQPGDSNRSEILAELYVMADQSDKAVAMHMDMLKIEPFKYDSYKALRQIYHETKQFDKTWCVCSTLSFLKQADEEELQFFESYKPRGFVKAKRTMTKDDWTAIRHPNENPYINAVFAAIWQGAAMVQARPHKAFGLKRKERRQLESDPLQFSKVMTYTSQVLAQALPDVYLQPDQPGEIALANTVEKNQLVPSLVVRQNLLRNRPEKEIAFAAARWLAVMRPEHYLKLALPTNTELKTAFLSAVAMVNPQFPIPQDMVPLVQQYIPHMQKHIPPQWYEQLAMVVGQFIQHAPEVSLSKWGHAVDASAHRLGFVMCGDIEVAARMVSQEPTVVGGPDVKSKVKELVVFSITEDYFGIRGRLGTTIG